MVKLTVDLIGKAARKKEEGLTQYLKKLTHLYFSEKNIDEIVSTLLIHTYGPFMAKGPNAR